MKVWDVEQSIFRGLQALPRRRYLSAMWILCGELLQLYAEQLSESDRPLMESTLNLLRSVLLSGRATVVGGEAGTLAAAWNNLIEDRKDDVLPGRRSAWFTFAALAAEIAGVGREYFAAELVSGAAIDRWREPRRGSEPFNPSQEIEDASPVAQTLDRFQRIVTDVGRLPESELNPMALRNHFSG